MAIVLEIYGGEAIYWPQPTLSVRAEKVESIPCGSDLLGLSTNNCEFYTAAFIGRFSFLPVIDIADLPTLPTNLAKRKFPLWTQFWRPCGTESRSWQETIKNLNV